MQLIGIYDINYIDVLCDSRNLIFDTKGKAIPENDISSHDYSLTFIKTNYFKIVERTYEDFQSKKQERIQFTYNWNLYDFPITDPVFLKKHQSNPNFLNDFKRIYMTLSLGIGHKGWIYKLAAGVILM